METPGPSQWYLSELFAFILRWFYNKVQTFIYLRTAIFINLFKSYSYNYDGTVASNVKNSLKCYLQKHAQKYPPLP